MLLVSIITVVPFREVRNGQAVVVLGVACRLLNSVLPIMFARDCFSIPSFMQQLT